MRDARRRVRIEPDGHDDLQSALLPEAAGEGRVAENQGFALVDQYAGRGRPGEDRPRRGSGAQAAWSHRPPGESEGFSGRGRPDLGRLQRRLGEELGLYPYDPGRVFPPGQGNETDSEAG